MLLVERGDIAQATSSASSKLIHGGLRYLESLHLGLVAESLEEREILLRIAPHLVRPLHLLIPPPPPIRIIQTWIICPQLEPLFKSALLDVLLTQSARPVEGFTVAFVLFQNRNSVLKRALSFVAVQGDVGNAIQDCDVFVPVLPHPIMGLEQSSDFEIFTVFRKHRFQAPNGGRSIVEPMYIDTGNFALDLCSDGAVLLLRQRIVQDLDVSIPIL